MTSRTESKSQKGFWKRERVVGGWRSRTMNQTCVIKNASVNAEDSEFDSYLTTKPEQKLPFTLQSKAKEKQFKKK